MICGKCSSHTATLAYEKGKAARVCDECFVILQDRDGATAVKTQTSRDSKVEKTINQLISCLSLSAIGHLYLLSLLGQSHLQTITQNSELLLQKWYSQHKISFISVTFKVVNYKREFWLCIFVSQGAKLIDGECIHKGYLQLSSDGGKIWKKRWFALHESANLYSFKAPQVCTRFQSYLTLNHQQNRWFTIIVSTIVSFKLGKIMSRRCLDLFRLNSSECVFSTLYYAPSLFVFCLSFRTSVL